MRSFRKALELFVIYFVLIIGIFILQFRTDSNIIEKIGNLQITLARLENSNDSSLLQNKLQISYNGLNFHSDDQTSAKIVQKNSNSFKNVQLLSYSKTDSKITLNFSENVKLNFEVAGQEADSTLSIYTELPSNIDRFYLPYNLSYSMKIEKEENNRLILNNKKSKWAFTTSEIADGFICMSSKEVSAHFAVYDDTKKFSFDMLTELAAADSGVYQSTVSKFTNNMVSQFKTALTDGSYTEREVIAYVAARAAEGRYNDAVEEIPASFKRSSSRTYLSTPYFNNLSEMNDTLTKVLRDSEINIRASIANETIDLFTQSNIASQLSVYPDIEGAKTLISNVAASDFTNASISLVTGILKAYDDLVSYESEYASLLQPAVTKALERLEAMCNIEDNKLVITDNGQFISVVQAVNTGLAVLRYGLISGNQTYEKTGYTIVNTYLADTTLDLKSSAMLYPVIAYENTFYPHFKVINPDINDFIWAWTCAENISQARDSDDNLSLVIKFPVEHTHYLIVKGLPKFTSIYIYNIAFRSDPRFESYNSSGYVYREDSMTLLLKSRNKAQFETVKMMYNGVPSRKNNASRTSLADLPEAPVETKPAAPAVTAARPATKYSVILGVSPNAKKRAIINEIKAARPDLSTSEATKLYDSAPAVLKEDLTKEEADALIVKIINAGGVANKK